MESGQMESGQVCLDNASFKLLENMRKTTYKSHRNIEEIDRTFTSDAVPKEDVA